MENTHLTIIILQLLTNRHEVLVGKFILYCITMTIIIQYCPSSFRCLQIFRRKYCARNLTIRVTNNNEFGYIQRLLTSELAEWDVQFFVTPIHIFFILKTHKKQKSTINCKLILLKTYIYIYIIKTLNKDTSMTILLLLCVVDKFNLIIFPLHSPLWKIEFCIDIYFI